MSNISNYVRLTLAILNEYMPASRESVGKKQQPPASHDRYHVINGPIGRQLLLDKWIYFIRRHQYWNKQLDNPAASIQRSLIHSFLLTTTRIELAFATLIVPSINYINHGGFAMPLFEGYIFHQQFRPVTNLFVPT
jgi:hypothetical protein